MRRRQRAGPDHGGARRYDNRGGDDGGGDYSRGHHGGGNHGGYDDRGYGGYDAPDDYGGANPG